MLPDSLAGFVVPLTWTRTNPSKYCSLSVYWNTSDYSGAGLTRSVFRDHGGMQNRMLDLNWDNPIVQVSSSAPYFRMALINMLGDQCWWEGNKILLATLTFILQDTMTVSFDSTLWPQNNHLAFARKDAVTYIPRLIQTEVPPETTLIADFSAIPEIRGSCLHGSVYRVINRISYLMVLGFWGQLHQHRHKSDPYLQRHRIF